MGQLHTIQLPHFYRKQKINKAKTAKSLLGFIIVGLKRANAAFNTSAEEELLMKTELCSGEFS